MLQICFELDGRIGHRECSCAIGMGEGCGHLCGLLYQIAHFKLKGQEFIPEV